MKTTTYNVLFTTIIAVSSYALSAQNSKTLQLPITMFSEVQKRQENFDTLKNLGYKELEIYEDLGNANFLSKNYDTAIFWYDKLFELSDANNISKNCYERYQHALKTNNKTTTESGFEARDWVAQVKEDYLKPNKKEYSYTDFSFDTSLKIRSLEAFVQKEIVTELNKEENPKNPSEIAFKNNAPIAISTDENTAYFGKPVYVKPLYGVFSKKELITKIYKAENKNGVWKTMGEVVLAPKNASAMHPAISEDGKRLFFASDMPGTFGKFDIYVAEMQKDGSLGIAKNLGEKVNTDQDDLFPKIVGGTSLFFASSGHQGYGGLDVYMVEVADNKVGYTVNLGSPINSNQDDFSIDIIKDKETGYVLLQRTKNQGNAQRVAYAYTHPNLNFKKVLRKDYPILEVLNNEANINYSTSVFEDK
jgi:hypothetical protein